MVGYRILRRILLVSIVRQLFSKVVDFYNNLPVYPGQGEFKVDVDKSQVPLFHVGNVMPLPDKSAIALAKVVDMALKENMIAVEIECWTGRSTSIIAKNIAKCHGTIYAVDHWKGSTDVWQYNITKTYNILSVFRHNMEVLGLTEIVYPMVMDSIIASRVFKNESLDFISISADHRYTPIKNDILAWLPKLKKGGILSGHACSGYYDNYSAETRAIIDANCEKDDLPGLCHPGITKALHDCFDDNYSIVNDSVVWYYLKGSI